MSAAKWLVTTVLVTGYVVLVQAQTGKPQWKLLFLPAAEKGEEGLPGLDAFSVHLVPENSKDEELLRPAGREFSLGGEPNRFRVWLEAPGFISPRQWILVIGELPRAEAASRPVRLPVVRAGAVRFSGHVDDAVGLRLLLLETGFARRVPPGNRKQPVQVPPGVVVGALFHTGRGEYLAVSRPTQVKANEVAPLEISPPQPPLTDLMVKLEPPRVSEGLPQVRVVLRTPDGQVAEPEAKGGDAGVWYCFWYGLRARWGEVEVSGTEFVAPKSQVALPVGRLAVAEIKLAEPPSLLVEMRLPQELIEERRVEVVAGDELVAKAAVPAQETTVWFPRVPPKPLAVRLTTGSWVFVEHVEPKLGEENTVVFEPPVFTVHGTVFVGDTPTPGTIEFATDAPGKWVSVATDDEGRYRTVLFAESPWARVRPEGAQESVLLEIKAPFRPETELDFHLPAVTLEVVVRGKPSGAPVEGAEVSILGATAQKAGPVYLLRARTDRQGHARLGPLLPGRVEVKVAASGYRGQRRALILEENGRAEVAFELEPEGEGREVKLVLPSGTPARGARVWVFASPTTEARWGGEADGTGTVRVPAGLCCLLAITHDDAGLTRVPWSDDHETPTVVLQRRAAPLRMWARRADGTPVPFARLRLWVGGQLVGEELAFRCLGTQLVFDHAGFWATAGLPAAPVEVVSFEPEAASLGRGGAFDSQRQEIPYPWPPEVVVQPFR